jgi:hypothetical protein
MCGSMKAPFLEERDGACYFVNQENLGQKGRGFWGLMRKPYKTPEFSSR